MRKSVFLNLTDKFITEKTYDMARRAEEKLCPNEFIAYYMPQTSIYWFIISAVMLFVSILFKTFNTALFFTALIASLGAFFIFIYYISYRCFVDEDGLTYVIFCVFKKRILWLDIINVNTSTQHYLTKPDERELILRNKQNKIVFSCSYELVGFNLILRKYKELRNRKEGEMVCIEKIDT